MIVRPLPPVAGAYFNDQSRVAVIVGPVGSGKSTASCLRLARHAYNQAPGADGIARTRWAIVRNTKPQLRDTTLKTWLQVFPEAINCKFRQTDMSHVWSFKPKGHAHPIHAEFIFRALDDESDVANLLSLEVTGFYFNELREIAEPILAHAGRRSGRFPSAGDGGCTWAGWIGDTNPWDTEHYLHERMVTNPREGWALFRQPSGMSAEAENRENLPATYYEDALKDYSAEDARVYVHAEWGRTRSGKPIYTEFSEQTHVRPFELSPILPIRIGMDFGRTPAAVIGQCDALGRWTVRHELCAFDMGVTPFAEQLARFLADRCRGFDIEQFTGDPAGEARDANDETVFQILAAAGFPMARPASTNDPSLRVGAVQEAFRRMTQGIPALVIHPECKMLTRACVDGYHYRKLKVAGDRYEDKPDKNQWSHVAEALQYLLLGGGEGRAMIRRHGRSENRQRFAIME
jgi:hypothetical protein